MPTDEENAESATDLAADSARHEKRRSREPIASATNSKPQRRVISLGRLAIGGLACLPLLLFALMFARFSSTDRVLAGVSIAGVEVGGATRAEVERSLRDHLAHLAREPLKLELGAKQAAVPLEDLGITLDTAASASRALSVGRSGSFFSNASRYLAAVARRESLAAETRVDGPRFAAALAAVEPKLIEDPSLSGCVSVDNGVPSAIPPRAGRKLELEPSRKVVTDAVAYGRSHVTLTAVTVTPALAPGALEGALARARTALSRTTVLEAGDRRLELSPSELGGLLSCRVEAGVPTLDVERQRLDAWLAPRRPELEAGAQDASFEVSSQDEVRVVPGASGVKLSTEAVAQALWQAASSPEHRSELPLLREPLPARSTEQAQALGIRRLVGAFTTRHPCCQPRVENIHRIAGILDGLVVEPGKEVSVNAIVGPRTLKNGFVLAPSIEDGEMVDTPGGGVSQFATTLFNALFRSGYEIIERKPHTYWFPRYPMGIEATLSWPHPDIVFKNDSAAGLLVKTSFTDKSITVKLYGDTGGRRVVTSVSDRRDIIQPTVELLPNRAVPPDEEKVKEGGMIGWSVLVERTVTFSDGTKREDKRKVTYKPKPRRVDVHPCRIPKGEPGASGEPCPEPEPEPEGETAAEPAQPG